MAMSVGHIATSTVEIDASRDRVWAVLTDPASVKQFMFGTDVITDWTAGNPILWRGVWKGREYEDKGVILEIEPGRRLVNTHFSPLTGKEDVPANYHTLTWTLEGDAAVTRFTLSQDNNTTIDDAKHSQEMWDSLVAAVKKIAEQS
jgi:uncharacterized protein YndB with AHSA1/START domain